VSGIGANASPLKAANVNPVRLSRVQVDRPASAAHNGFYGMRAVFRPLVVLSLVVAIAGAALAECVTEDLTPEQKACCAAMGHNCGAAGAEMGCCPTEPQTQDRVQASGVKPDLVAPVLLAGPLAILPEPHVRLHAVAAVSFDREALKLPDRPTYLVLSVFLI
jgi:hypothetical protein